MARAISLLLLGACASAARVQVPPAGLQRATLAVGGRERTYAWAGPADGRRPLVIALHGRGSDGAGQARLSHLDELARREGFLVVFPDGVGHSWADARAVSAASREGVDDVAFLRALIDRLAADGRIDPSRVYATGMSNGAMMTWTLACALADRLTAVAPVSGAMPAGLACAPARPLSVLSFAGTDDPLVPYEGGAGSALLSAEASVAAWAQLAGCAAPPVEEALPDADPADGTRARTRRFGGCAGGTVVELVTIEHGGHSWPGGHPRLPASRIGLTSRDLDASEMMWRFFAAAPVRP